MKKKRKRVILLCVYTIFFYILTFFRPAIIIHGASDNTAEIEAVMDVFDKKFDGDVSLWYLEKIKHSTRKKICKPNKKIQFKYPLFYDKKGSRNFYILYLMEKNEYHMRALHRFKINAEELYFFRLNIYLDNDGHINESYIKKYPLSKKLKYEPKDKEQCKK